MADSKRISVDLGELARLWGDLKSASAVLSGADNAVNRIGDAIVHSELEGKVREFATLWGKTRESLIQDMDVMWQNVQIIENSLRDVDTKLKQSLDGKLA